MKKDIINSIKLRSKSEVEQTKILDICKQIQMMNLNVGSDQLIRSILTLTEYSPEKMKIILENKFGGDPRDILVEANRKEPNINYGINTFNRKKADNK